MKFLFFVLIYISIVEADPFTLTKIEKNKIKHSFNAKTIAVRFHRFYQFLNKAQSFDLNKKLIRTNVFINNISPRRDDKTNSWSTPKEFLINGYGDCEDYAIAKYFTLKELKLPQNKLFFAVVKVKGSPTFHMVLLYDKEKLLVLDNLSWKIKPLRKRKDLKLSFIFNNKYSFTLHNNKLIKDKYNKNEVYFLRKFIKKVEKKNF